jgi:hypothetical protein
MLENNAKKWYGSYSRAGRASAENFYAIVHKEDILSKETKKIKSYYEKQRSNLEYLDDNINFNKIFNTNYTITKIPFETQKKVIKKEEKPQFGHNKNQARNGNIYIEPTCTKYNPKYDLIFKKLITGPNWKDKLGRNYPIQNFNSSNCFLNINPFHKIKKNKIKNLSSKPKKQNKNRNENKYSIIETGVSKCLVNMDKTTQRGEFLNNALLRIRTDRPFKKENKKLKSSKVTNLSAKHKNNTKTKEINIIDNSKNNCCLTEGNKENKVMPSINKNINSTKKKWNLKKAITRNIYPNFDSPLLRKVYSIKNKVYKVPNFAKIISRDKLEQLREFRNNFKAILNPNYSYIRERSLSMVKYKLNKNKIKKMKKFNGIDHTFNFNIDKIVSKYNNHKEAKASNFDNMTSRAYSKTNPLPNYMQGIYTRMTVDEVNDKTLKLNGFSDGKYMAATNSFFPKSSFNKIINLSLLKSYDLNDNNIEEYNEIQNQKLAKQIGDNYEDLVLDGSLDNFDKITFKTLNNKKKEHRNLRNLLLLNDNNEFQDNNEFFNKVNSKE